MKTFAKRAEAIKKRYPNHAVSKRDHSSMMMELQGLADEQEAMKASMTPPTPVPGKSTQMEMSAGSSGGNYLNTFALGGPTDTTGNPPTSNEDFAAWRDAIDALEQVYIDSGISAEEAATMASDHEGATAQEIATVQTEFESMLTASVEGETLTGVGGNTSGEVAPKMSQEESDALYKQESEKVFEEQRTKVVDDYIEQISTSKYDFLAYLDYNRKSVLGKGVAEEMVELNPLSNDILNNPDITNYDKHYLVQVMDKAYYNRRRGETLTAEELRNADLKENAWENDGLHKLAKDVYDKRWGVLPKHPAYSTIQNLRKEYDPQLPVNTLEGKKLHPITGEDLPPIDEEKSLTKKEVVPERRGEASYSLDSKGIPNTDNGGDPLATDIAGYGPDVVETSSVGRAEVPVNTAAQEPGFLSNNSDMIMAGASAIPSIVANVSNLNNLQDPNVVTPEMVKTSVNSRFYDPRGMQDILANNFASSRNDLAQRGGNTDDYVAALNKLNLSSAQAQGQAEIEGQRINQTEQARIDTAVSRTNEINTASVNQANIDQAQREDFVDSQRRDYVSAIGTNVGGIFSDISDSMLAKKLAPMYGQKATLENVG